MDPGRRARAEEVFLDALERPDRERVAFVEEACGDDTELQGRFEEAEPLFREVLVLRRRLYEPGHPSLGTSLNNLGSVLRRLGDPAAAEPLIREALEIQRATTGSADPRTAFALRNLAGVLVDLERHDEAEPLLLEALDVFGATLGAGNEQTRATHDVLATLYEARGRTELAAEHRARGAAILP